MRILKPILAAVALAGALASLQATAQMRGGPTMGPIDGMTNGSEDLIVPAGIRGPGQAGAFFVTDLWIKATTTGSVTLEYHATDSASSAPTATATVPLYHRITYLADVLQSTFGLPNAFGVIRVVATFPVSATTRVYNQSGAGAYVLAFMGMPARMAMTSMPASGTFGSNDFAMYMVGLLPEPGNRVNVNVVSTSAAGASGVVEIFDADGAAPNGSGAKSFPFALAGFSSHQFNDVLAQVGSRFPGSDAALQIRVRMDQGLPGTVMAYAVVNDNVTSDGYIVMGTMANGGAGMGAQ